MHACASVYVCAFFRACVHVPVHLFLLGRGEVGAVHVCVSMCRVLYILQFLKNSGGEAIQNAIAIVESASDEGGDWIGGDFGSGG